jgi:hypothetical protein
MKANRIKKIILALLALVLIYVWSSNLSLFTQGESSIRDFRETPQTEIHRDMADNTPEYTQAKTNPFRKPGNVTTSKPPARKRPEPLTPPPLKLSGMFLFTGVIDRQEFSQVVLIGKKGGAVIRGIGDSLAGWELTYVSMDMVIFTNEKFKDTLFLAE